MLTEPIWNPKPYRSCLNEGSCDILVFLHDVFTNYVLRYVVRSMVPYQIGVHATAPCKHFEIQCELGWQEESGSGWEMGIGVL